MNIVMEGDKRSTRRNPLVVLGSNPRHCLIAGTINTVLFVLPIEGQGLLILEVFRSHTKTHHSRYDFSGRVISPSQRPLTTHNDHNRQTSMPPGGIRTHDLSRRAAVDLRLRPRGHWDQQLIQTGYSKCVVVPVEWASSGGICSTTDNLFLSDFPTGFSTSQSPALFSSLPNVINPDHSTTDILVIRPLTRTAVGLC